MLLSDERSSQLGHLNASYDWEYTPSFSHFRHYLSKLELNIVQKRRQFIRDFLPESFQVKSLIFQSVDYVSYLDLDVWIKVRVLVLQ